MTKPNDKLRIIFEEDPTAIFCPHGKSLDTYRVYWDCETQSELWRGTHAEADKLEDGENGEDGFAIFGGGSYCMYTCLSYWKIVEVISRQLSEA